MTFHGRFLGAAQDIGRLGFILEMQDTRFLFDYGIQPDKPPEYPLEAPPVDQVFLTHAHMDHSGMIPWLAHRFESMIMTTPVTAEVSTLMHHDSLKIARLEGFPEPFTTGDIDTAGQMYDFMDWQHPRHVAGMKAQFHTAGHIPGASQVQVTGDSGSIVFTGDLYTRPQRLVGPGQPVKCDVLCMETTYAGREHTPRDEVEREFLDFATEVIDRGGKLLVPTFAIGRAQELAMVLADAGHNVWMDGMARQVSRIFAQYPEYLRDFGKYQRAMGQIKMIRNHRGRSVALGEADVILTTSGMMDGGPILFYLDRLRNDPRSAVAICGYQVQGTNGRRLLDEGVIDFDNRDPGKKVHKVECEVRTFDFSAHAGHSDLVEFARQTGAKDIVLFHGDKRELLVPDLSDFATVHTPDQGEDFVIA